MNNYLKTINTECYQTADNESSQNPNTISLSFVIRHLSWFDTPVPSMGMVQFISKYVLYPTSVIIGWKYFNLCCPIHFYPHCTLHHEIQQPWVPQAVSNQPFLSSYSSPQTYPLSPYFHTLYICHLSTHFIKHDHVATNFKYC